MKPLRFVYHSVMGYDHLRLKRNCQDSLHFSKSPDFVVGFVVDGMGDSIDSPFSEVGSRIVAKLAEEYVTKRLKNVLKWRRKALIQSDIFWSDVQNYLLGKVESFALLMEGNYKSNIIKYFLFTLTGFVLIPEVTVFVGVGDGFAVVNEIAYPMADPSEGNMPASLSYNLVESTLRKMSPGEITLSVKWIVNTSEIDSFAIATDGLRALLSPENDYFVFREEKYCFWNQQEMFENEYELGWKLNDLASEKKTIDWDNQVLVKQKPIVTDDLAIIIGSRI